MGLVEKLHASVISIQLLSRGGHPSNDARFSAQLLQIFRVPTRPFCSHLARRTRGLVVCPRKRYLACELRSGDDLNSFAIVASLLLSQNPALLIHRRSDSYLTLLASHHSHHHRAQ